MHHEPTRRDDELDRVFAELLQRFPVGDDAALSEIFLAREGLEVQL